MGKRKSSRAKKLLPKKKIEKVAKVFSCPFCGCPDSVDCKIESAIGIGTIHCWACREMFRTSAHRLTEPIDIFTEWFDACVTANQPI